MQNRVFPVRRCDVAIREFSLREGYQAFEVQSLGFQMSE